MRRALVWIGLVSVAACGDGDHLAPDAAPDHAPPDAFVFAPAIPTSVPQVMSEGGPVVASPKVLPIFFSTDDAIFQGEIEQFLATLAPSAYWTTTTSEYGIGAPTILPSVVVSDAPPTTDDDLQVFVRNLSDGTHAGVPTPDENTIYTVFLPPGAVLTQGGDKSCVAFGGYHSNTTGAQGEDLIYALLPRCTSPNIVTLDFTTQATSHELIEASSDPLFFKQKAWFQLDPDHLVWGRLPGGELGDMCEFLTTAPARDVGNFVVQRTWSNASVAAGHDPCVPVPSDPFVAGVPVLTDDVPFGMSSMTKGVSVPLGGSKTIDVALYSDDESAGDFHVDAIEAGSLTGTPDNALDLVFDRRVGHNGDVVHLTITRVRQSPRGGTEIAIRTTTIPGIQKALWFGFVAN